MQPGDPAARHVDVVVIGAGQAGLSSAYHLHRQGFASHHEFVVLDRSDGPGGAWRHRWPSLRLDDVHGIHDLPGLAFGGKDETRPAADVVAEYFGDYEKAFDLPVLRPAGVTAVRRGNGDRLLVASSAGSWSARAVINATGTWTHPFRPHCPGQESFTGRQLHTADYRDAEEFRGHHVIVVGGGISAVELLSEISRVATTTWATRRPPVFTGTEFTSEDGRAAVATVERQVRAGLPPGSIVGLTGLPSTPAIRRAHERGVLERSPMFDRITPTGVAWNDGTEVAADAILWATGFRPAIDHLAPLGLREPGGGIRLDGTQAVAEPRLHLVGYGPSASTVGANRAGRSAACAVTAAVRGFSRPGGEPGHQRRSRTRPSDAA
ncbi:cation diffusion facilitator CzcD-associated flavoprotein CzcO [Halopolyspora algeriensis]|uniref:Cation diffusion facilitator CzcD-associated flavoprotein CzcO n=1 Tax=Halopolyspora algeriensis TaxID=1500506 RepID=A0A368VTM5_9ACTN|nr:FAD-dependent oxidoreductase [Halopolyspora algeriensis]RCW44433.1 cation diffusion facilitator CzcD-associated flavoprotein CzcO [Halopolyspora algeriensis]TQM55794.1 cation diffusion facilitator CzcD-associated flavoprotein CzcO [Halopolyspora algeriensis]